RACTLRSPATPGDSRLRSSAVPRDSLPGRSGPTGLHGLPGTPPVGERPPLPSLPHRPPPDPTGTRWRWNGTPVPRMDPPLVGLSWQQAKRVSEPIPSARRRRSNQLLGFLLQGFRGINGSNLCVRCGVNGVALLVVDPLHARDLGYDQLDAKDRAVV